VRSCRLLVGMTQKALATELDLTAQLVQIYESGSSPIHASVLKEIAGIFGMPVSYFFEERAGSSRPNDAQLGQVEMLKLVRFYYTMPERVRRRFLKMVKAVAAASTCR
jgi:transcriptional regulator with XRE-family HTH domain